MKNEDATLLLKHVVELKNAQLRGISERLREIADDIDRLAGPARANEDAPAKEVSA